MKKNSHPNEGYMPVGLAMTLATHTEAMRAFARLTPEEQDDVISRARRTGSREEMEAIVTALHRSTELR